MAIKRSLPVTLLCILVTCYALFLLVAFSHFGGALNRGRGGWVNFYNTSNCTLCLPYWPAHLCKNLLFAVPTGAIVVSAGAGCPLTSSSHLIHLHLPGARWRKGLAITFGPRRQDSWLWPQS